LRQTASFEPLCVKLSIHLTYAGVEEKKAGRKEGRKSHKKCIFQVMRGATTSGRIPTKLGKDVRLTDLIKRARDLNGFIDIYKTNNIQYISQHSSVSPKNIHKTNTFNTFFNCHQYFPPSINTHNTNSMHVSALICIFCRPNASLNASFWLTKTDRWSTNSCTD